VRRALMERSLSLIKNELGLEEKRILPRFPFCFMTFKEEGSENAPVYEVKDISMGGMQLSLRNGSSELSKGQDITGHIHWYGPELKVHGKVQWATDMRIGISFDENASFDAQLQELLSPKSVAEVLRVVDPELGLDMPSNLKLWLTADGPIDLYVWQHSHGEIARFQIVLMENFVEWEDGKGLKSGRVMSKRNVDTPLLNEDEFIFQLEDELSSERVEMAKALVMALKENKIKEETKNFLLRKLGI